MFRRIMLGLLPLLAACSVQPLTPTPVALTKPPAVVSLMTFTPAPTLISLPSETPAPADTATPSVLPTPSPALAPQLIVANPVVLPVPKQEVSQASPAAVPPVPVAPPPSAAVAAAEQYCIDLINAQRATVGVAALSRDETLMDIARARVADMVARGYTGHTDPVTGERLARAMMRAAGYTSNYLGENWYGTINAPPAIVEVAMNWFMTDPPHAQNILNPNYVSVGVGIAYNGQQWLLVQNFVGN